MVSRWESEAWATCHLDPVAEPGQNKHSPTHDTLIGIFVRSAEQYAPTASYSWTERGRLDTGARRTRATGRPSEYHK
jgi:hypothetical protein